MLRKKMYRVRSLTMTEAAAVEKDLILVGDQGPVYIIACTCMCGW